MMLEFFKRRRSLAIVMKRLARLEERHKGSCSTEPCLSSITQAPTNENYEEDSDGEAYQVMRSGVSLNIPIYENMPHPYQPAPYEVFRPLRSSISLCQIREEPISSNDDNLLYDCVFLDNFN